MKNKKRNRILILVLLLLGVTVGFAVLSTTLKINGFGKVSKGSWSIHWDNIANEDGVNAETPAYIKDQKKQIVEFEVLLAEPGNYYEFEVDAVNDGTLNGILKKVKSEVNGVDIDDDPSVLPDYFVYSLTYADGSTPNIGDELLVGEYQTYKVRVEYDKEEVTNEIVNEMDEPEEYVFEIEIEYELDPYEKPAAPDDFEDDSWPTIAEEGPEAAKQEEVVNGKCGAYNLGDTKTLAIDMDDNGITENYTVRIANCSTPAICNTEGFSQSACGFVLEFTDLLTSRQMNPVYSYGRTFGDGNYGGWAKSDMRAWLNGLAFGAVASPYTNDPIMSPAVDYTRDNSFLSKLPSELRKHLADTYMVSGYGYSDNTNRDSTDKIYMLAVHEIYEDIDGNPDSGISAMDTAYDTTRQLDIYAESGNFTVPPPESGYPNHSTNYKHHLDGTDEYWWLRSANNTSSGNFFVISSGGSWHTITANDTANSGVAPAFRLK